MNLWSKLEDIYNNFNARLKQQGISYEGAIYREVIEQKNLDLPHKHYLFVGFNLLQKVEQELFNIIKKEGKAQFYWDFDKYYTTNNQQEAGYYIKQYLSIYPNELDNSDDSIYNCFKKEKDITYISATTNNIQARNIADWLQHNDRIKAGKDTVIVLCDENFIAHSATLFARRSRQSEHHNGLSFTTNSHQFACKKPHHTTINR